MESNVSSPHLVPRGLLGHHPLGASTGYLSPRGDWERLVEEAVDVSLFATELAALSEPEFSGLLDYLTIGHHLPFHYTSVHAPIKDREMDDLSLAACLAQLPLSIDAIVVHPDAMTDPEVFRPVGRRLTIENMDVRKANGKTPADLQVLFDALPEAGFCFDIAHAWSIDPTLELAADLLDRFASRLRHVHLSSWDDGAHVALLRDHEERFAPLLARCRDVPWILEAPPPTHWASWLMRAVPA